MGTNKKSPAYYPEYFYHYYVKGRVNGKETVLDLDLNWEDIFVGRTPETAVTLELKTHFMLANEALLWAVTELLDTTVTNSKNRQDLRKKID
jgi:hypothetical protein